MRTKIQTIVFAAVLLAGYAAAPLFSQAGEHGKMGKMAGKKMSHDEMVAKIEKMSTDDKAALIDKMPAKDRMAAMKASGQDAANMSAQQKADMFDKMPLDKKMTMIGKGSMMHNGKKMGKGATDK